MFSELHEQPPSNSAKINVGIKQTEKKREGAKRAEIIPLCTRLEITFLFFRSKSKNCTKAFSCVAVSRYLQHSSEPDDNTLCSLVKSILTEISIVTSGNTKKITRSLKR